MVIIRLGLKLSDPSGKRTGAEFTSVMSTWNASPSADSESLDKAMPLESYRLDSRFERDREP
jgi:hypothetical protein